MPSLEQLKNFKASFGSIADEAAITAQLNLPPDDLPLPDSEPVGPPPSMGPVAPVAAPSEATPPEAVPVEPAPEETPVEAAPQPDTPTPAGRSSVPEPPPPVAPLPPAEPPPATEPPSTAEPPPPVESDAEPDDLGLDLNFADLLGGGPANLSPPPAAEAVIEEALAKAAPETAGEPSPVGETGPDETSAPVEETGPDEMPAPVEETGSEEAFAPEDLPDISDLNFDDAFAGFGESEDGAEAEAPSGPDDFDSDVVFTDFDNAGAEDAGIDEAGLGEDDIDETGVDGIGPDAVESLDEDLDFQDFPDFDDAVAAASAETGEPDGAAAFPEMTEEAASIPDFDDMDLDAGPDSQDFPAEEADSGAMEGLLDGFADDIEAERAVAEDAQSIPGEESGETDFENAFPDVADMAMGVSSEDADSFDSFSPDGGTAGFSGGGESGAPAAPEPDFAMPGIDDLFGGNAPKIPGMESSATAGAIAPEDTVEEIRLDQDDLAWLQNTLSNYPLNLRIAIEEIIAEQAVAPNLMSSLIKLLVRNGSPKEAAALAEKILNKPIPIPKSFEKKTGEALEAEQASFPYIFTRRFLPALRFFLVIALLAASVFYLSYRFIYTPARANSIYQQGYGIIPEGNYAQANEYFNRAFRLHRQKDWFYRYAEAFRDERQYIYAEEKYDQLLNHFPRDKKGALDYADMETNYLRNYAKADRIIRLNILEYAIDDQEGLTALGDNNLIWGEIDPSRYEEARSSYARLLEVYGWQDPIVERMMKYFIRVDNLGEVLPLQRYFTANPERRRIAASTLAELGGYLLDKRFEEVRGVPDEHISQIEGIRDILLQAVQAAPRLPEAHYHLARYYGRFGNNLEERQTLEIAARLFDTAPEESARRTRYRLDAQRRLGEILINNREFFSAEEQLVKGIGLYEDALDRRFLTRSPEFGRLYADLGDLEYFAKSGNMPLALEYYLQSELNGWAPPEIQYRIGAAYYQQGQWAPALDRFFAVSTAVPANRRLLNALGNASYMRGDYFNAQGYYSRLANMLGAESARFPLLMPNDNPEQLDLAERLMVVRNNLAVTLEALTRATGNRSYRSRALGLYAESARAWDSLTRSPTTMIRAGAGDLSAPGMNLAFLNSRNTLYPEPDYEPQLYIQIDRDILEPSDWENLVPRSSSLTDAAEPYRRGR